MITETLAEDEASPRITPFVGSWRLLSCELETAEGEKQKPFGEHPAGLIIYQADGHMSAQVMRPESPAFANPDPSQATDKETSAAWQDYLGYWGTFSVDERRGRVIHQIEGCWFPNWIGGEQIRHFRFEGRNTLELEGDSAAGKVRLIWKRI